MPSPGRRLKNSHNFFLFEVLKGEKAYSVSHEVLMAPPVMDSLPQTSLNVLGLPALMVQDG